MHLMDGSRAKVLDESPAESNVDNLHTAADSHDRQPRSSSASNQRNLRLVDALIHSVTGRRYRALFVEGRVDISSSQNQQTIEPLEACGSVHLPGCSGSYVQELEVRTLGA